LSFNDSFLSCPRTINAAFLNTLRKLAEMTWHQVYSNHGLKWEAILSQKGPGANKLYNFRISKGFWGGAYREGSWLRLLSLLPDHNSAYL